jgi:hypothetical protein
VAGSGGIPSASRSRLVPARNLQLGNTGTRIPIRAPEAILEEKPDYLLILPWNLRDEVAAQMSCIRGWGGRFVVPIPTVQVF